MDIKTLCLGVLTDGDMAGYDIKKYFEQAFSHFFVAGFGSIYPALAELTRDGLVDVNSVEQEKRPDKKVYRITKAGRVALEQALSDTDPRHKVRSEFLVLTYFAHLLSPGVLADKLGRRIAEWEQVLETLGGYEADAPSADCRCPAGVRFTIGFGRAVIGAALDYTRRHRDELIERAARDGADAATTE
ncbi:MAG: PadR family transcriptional regulator [Gammaproteobacteria bacterium]|nr:PadR family transcriptional regulator [Gammaproteobacteria bacterium]NIR96815.1 PadR family transcriptional regulator [Gammaproteobacteria bacterium]NIT62515.1 PadR family transcriptional regulator [Gammaproteobacteria bacterium]NIV19455.1 PadR family transcriptional regulator [Gammaproteobacteria bacterium]NIX10538.1 PadR family transcriptional regulator [Gammaproteobacteria bacterium]